jgi:hypothetical protein
LVQLRQNIKTHIESLVADQTLSLTQKNKLMLPLIQKSKILNDTIEKFELIDNTVQDGACSAN